MTAQRMLAGLQIGLLAALAVGDLVLLAESLGAWAAGTVIPWPSLAEAVPLGMVFGGLLLTLNYSTRWLVVATALVAAIVGWCLNKAGQHDYLTPLFAAYFAALWLSVLWFRSAGLAWRRDADGSFAPPQIGLRTLLLLMSAAAVGLAGAGIFRRNLGPEEEDVSLLYGTQIMLPFNDEGSGILWLQLLAGTAGVVLAVVSLATLLIVSRRGRPIMRTLGAVLVSAAACGLFLYAWRLESQWMFMVIESGFLAGFIAVNAAVIRGAGWTLEKTLSDSNFGSKS